MKDGVKYFSEKILHQIYVEMFENKGLIVIISAFVLYFQSELSEVKVTDPKLAIWGSDEFILGRVGLSKARDGVSNLGLHFKPALGSTSLTFDLSFCTNDVQ